MNSLDTTASTHAVDGHAARRGWVVFGTAASLWLLLLGVGWSVVQLIAFVFSKF